LEPNAQGIYAGSLDNSKERIRILATDHKVCHVPSRDSSSGFLLWLRDQTLLAQPFDAGKLRLIGEPMPLAEEVAIGPPIRAAFWSSDAGLLVYRTGEPFPKGTLVWIDRNGKLLGEAGKEGRYGSIHLSPDGTRVAMTRLNDDQTTSDIWVLEFARDVFTRLTFDPRSEGVPVWSPDGRQVAFYSDRTGVRQIYRKDAGGGGQEEQLTNNPTRKSVSDWSRDGRYLLLQEGETAQDLWALQTEGKHEALLVLKTPFTERAAEFSPDGKWIVYESDQSGRTEVYVRAFPVSAGQWQVSNRGGSRPKWSADGKELFYVGPTGSSIVAVAIRIVGASFQSDTPRELFTISPVHSNLTSPFDVTADSQRFLVVQPSAVRQAPPLTVVTNWQARLKK
jgi:dipeptidyl aminopeptidase/acylaminoacyl peptidase